MIHTHTANIQTNIVHAVVPSWVLAVLIGVVGGVRLSPLGHRSSSSLSYSLTFFLYAIMITSGLFVHCLFLVECEAAAPSKVGRRMRGRQRAKEGGVVLVCLYDCICVCLSLSLLLPLPHPLFLCQAYFSMAILDASLTSCVAVSFIFDGLVDLDLLEQRSAL